MQDDDFDDIVRQPHDGLFERVFGQPEHAIPYFAAVLPAVLSRQLELHAAQRVPGSCVDEALKQRHSDLLYTVPTAAGDSVLVYLLFKHQRTVDPLMAFRLLRYMTHIWDRWLQDHENAETLPPIVPLVLYHGPSHWTAKRDFNDVVQAESGLAAALEGLVPTFQYLLHDLGQVDDAQLVGSLEGELTLLLFKHIDQADVASVIQAVQHLLTLLSNRALSAITPFVYYLFSARVENPREVFDVMDSVMDQNSKGRVLSTAEQLIAQGEARARRELLLEMVEHLPLEDRARLRAIDDLEQLKREIIARLTGDP